MVTHEMYAAGHPPLPGFEIATFCSQMPPHWESAAENCGAGQAVTFTVEFPVPSGRPTRIAP